MPLRFLVACLLLPCACSGAVERIEILERTDVLEGAPFASAGPYERIVAKVYFAVDPALPANRAIADVDLAPRGERGRVEFSADLYVLKPRDSARGNGSALVEISNRGGKGLLSMFNFAPGSADPRTAPHFGDRFLLEQGFTLVWIGWEFDVPPAPGILRLSAPIAADRGQPITGLVRSEWTGDSAVATISLGDRAQTGYPASDPADPANRMYVRDSAIGERRLVPRTDWTFSDPSHVSMPAGFAPGKIYEVVYKAKDPVLAGLGFAAVRDLASFLKYGGAETLLGDQRQYLKRAIGFGVSQSGRFLRAFLYDGFNADEKGRRVFDGVWAHVAGAGRGSFNARFAQPSRDGHPFLNVLYPVDVPPFTDIPAPPEVGLLAKAQRDGVVPKIFYTNGAYEYWGRAASLIHTTPDGKADAPLAPGTRIYFIAGTQHVPGSIPPRLAETRYPTNTNDYRYALRALLARMQAWLKDAREPPASEYPLIAKDQLVPLGAYAFPKLEDVPAPRRKREAYRLDFSTEPPQTGPPYPTLVPQVNLDGNETSGVRLPDIQAPLGSYTGWNLRAKSIGAPGELFSMAGSFLAFPANETERANRKDPRLSIARRYQSKREYLEQITAAAAKLVESGFLLDRDVPGIRARAAQEWEYVLRSN